MGGKRILVLDVDGDGNVTAITSLPVPDKGFIRIGPDTTIADLEELAYCGRTPTTEEKHILEGILKK